MDKNPKGTKHLDTGGFAYGDIPKGFERIRPPHEDDPLTPSGRRVYYFVAVIVVLIALLVVVAAIMEAG